MRKNFKAPWDLLLILLTAVVAFLLIGVNYIFTSDSIFPLIMGLCIILFCALFGIYGYRIQDGKMRVVRLGWFKDFPISDIKSVEYHPNAMKGSLRTWGIGGLFGYIGHFKNRLLSNYKAYATHRRKTVIINTKENEQIVITPDDPKEFVESLRFEIKDIEEIKG